MKSNKSPGSDGFTSEFFKMFWKLLGTFVVRSINYGYLTNNLSITQRHGIITCLPKGDKPKQFLKNWRPISLLNTVYKIASGIIATRIKKHLDKIIHSDQTGFIKGRNISENIRTIYDIMQYTEEENIPGLLLLIDFEKAFDSISWSFIQKSLQFFKFGNSIQKWVKLFYTNITAAVNQGGHISETFFLHRGCRQGDPLSPYLFLICAEILAILIRNNKNIKGIEVLDKEYKITMLADDTSLILDGSAQSLQLSLKTLKYFAKISGLHINYSKTQVIWIGSMKHSNHILDVGVDLEWGKSAFRLLGIDFDVDLQKIGDLNFKQKFEKIKKNYDKLESQKSHPTRAFNGVENPSSTTIKPHFCFTSKSF